MSSYLFIICSEAFTNLIKMAVVKEELRDMRISKSGAEITHLLLVDDSLLFCEAYASQIKYIKQIL